MSRSQLQSLETDQYSSSHYLFLFSSSFIVFIIVIIDRLLFRQHTYLTFICWGKNSTMFCPLVHSRLFHLIDATIYK